MLIEATEVAYGCVYILGYQAWSRIFGYWVDPLARRVVSSRLGGDVVWARASSFPVELWSWGIAAQHGALLTPRLLLGCASTCLAGAFLPVLAVCSALRWTRGLSPHLSEAIYLATGPLMLGFVASQMRHGAAGIRAAKNVERVTRHSLFIGKDSS